jgi:hypothetical protein
MAPSPTSSPAAPMAPTIWLNSPPTSANDAPVIARLVQRGTGNEQSNRQHYKPKIEAYANEHDRQRTSEIDKRLHPGSQPGALF